MSQSDSGSSSFSAAKLAANRFNAARSTGPRTPRGKAIAARNALKHGLFARELLLPGEDAEALTQLKTALLRRLNPRDPMEWVLVERVVAATWKLQRLERFEAALFRRECDTWDENPLHLREHQGLGRREPIPAETAWVSASSAFQTQLDRLAAQQCQLERAMGRSLRQLALLQKQDIYEPATEYALEAVAAEQAAEQNRQNEATATQQLIKQASIAELQHLRIEKSTERKAEAQRQAKNRKNQAKRRRQRARESERKTYTIPTIAAREAAERQKRENEATGNGPSSSSDVPREPNAAEDRSDDGDAPRNAA